MGCVFLLTPFLIYFPRFIPGIETQPWLALGLALLALASCRDNTGRSFAGVLVVAVCLLGLVVAALGGLPLAAGLSTLQFAVGPVLLCGVATWRPLPPSRRCMAVVAAVFALLAAFELLLPAAYESFASLLLERASVANGYRGVSLLTPEPTYASISLIYALMLAMWSRRFFGSQFPWVEYALVGLLLLTFSTYALLLLAALAVMCRPIMVILAGLTAALVTQHAEIVGIDAANSIRAISAVSRLLSVRVDSLLPSISLLDPSLGLRLISLAAGATTVFDHPTGFGLGCASVANAFTTFGWDFASNDPVLGPELRWGCLKPASFLTAVLLAYGALALVLFVIIVFSMVRLTPQRPVVQWWPPLLMAVLILTVQCQLTNPVPWFMLYMSLLPARKIRVAMYIPEEPAGKSFGHERIVEVSTWR